MNDEQVNSIFEAIIGMAQADFSKRAVITDNASQLDAIASGANMLAEQFDFLLQEKKITEEKLIKSNVLFSGLFNNNPAAIAISRLSDGQIININDSFLQLFGFTSHEEVIGKTAAELNFMVHPEQRAELGRLLKENKIVRNFEADIQTRQGELKWGSASAMILEIDNTLCLFSVTIDITERKKTEDQLKEYHHFFNNSNDLCVIANHQGYFERINPTLENTLGYSSTELTTIPFTDFVHPDDLPAVLNEYAKQQTENARLANFICRFRTKDEKYIWVEWNSIPNVESGKIYAIGRNITERKKVEEQLKEYQYFFNNNHDLCGIANTTGYFETINANFIKVLGYSEKEFCRTPFIELIHPDDIASTLVEYEKLKAGALVINFVNRYRKKDGNYLWLDWNATPNPLTGKLYCVARDITERKKVEEEILKLKQEYELIFNSVEDGIHGIDKDGNIIFENPTAVKMLGWDIKELIGKPAHSTIHHTYANRLPYPVSECNIYATLSDGKDRIVEDEVFWRKDGTSFPVSYSSSPMRNVANEIIGTIVTFRDITERKKTEELLKKSNELFFSLFENNPSSIVISRLNDGKIVNVNSAFLELYGFSSKEEVIGKSGSELNIFAHPEQRDQMASLIKANKSVKDFQINGLTKHGHNLSLSTSVIVLEVEQTLCLLAVSVDITERKKAEELLKEKSKELADRNHEIIDSINYAQRIQKAIINKPLATIASFNGRFILLLPKDILSGDFFWHYKVGDVHFKAVVDCTGHGVPGALMSLIAHQFLNQVVIEEKCYQPAEILKRLDKKLVEALHQHSNDEVRDGMDIALCRIDAKEKIITFSGALRPLYYFNGSKLIEIKGSRHAIGGLSNNGDDKNFGQEEITYNEGDCIYLTSDGYQSQFNGRTGKKMMKIRMHTILESAATKDAEEQALILKKYITDWRGKEEQVDDVLIVGVKF